MVVSYTWDRGRVHGKCSPSSSESNSGALAIGPHNRTAIWFLEKRKGLESNRAK